MENTSGFLGDNGSRCGTPLRLSSVYVCPRTPSRKAHMSNHNTKRPDMKPAISSNVTNLIDAVSLNNFDKVREFIKAGHNLLVDKDGKSPIHIAAENGQFDILKYLLHAFPMYNVNTPDNFESTPLHKAASIGQIDIIQILLERGAQVNIQDSTSLFTPLHLAVQGGHNQTARNLIKCGADITAQNRFGDTPLHTGVRYGHAGVSRILISVCPDINQQNQNGDTALHIAAALKRRKITKLLVESGANVDIKNIQNETPFNVAMKKNHSEIIEILRSASYNHTPKSVSFLPEVNHLGSPTDFTAVFQSGRDNFSVQSRHVSIPNEMCSVVNSPELKPYRAQSQSPHEKVKPVKKSNIVKGIFSRKKKDKVDKTEKTPKKPKEDPRPPLPQVPVNKSILTNSNNNSRRNSNLNPEMKRESSIQTKPIPVPGIMNTYQPQLGSQFFKDLAGNIKQGPIGYMPIASNSTCNCTQFSQHQNKRINNQFYPSNVCMDHGYIDYHGSLNYSSNKQSADAPVLLKCPEKHAVTTNKKEKVMSCHVFSRVLGNKIKKDKSRDSFDSTGYSLTRAKSDESLNQSEHKSRMQEERIKQAWNASTIKNSPVKGRRQNVDISNWNVPPNSLARPIRLESGTPKSSVQISQKLKEFKDSKDLLRTTMRPSPDGQTDSMTTPVSEHPRFKVDWRAGKYRPDKIILPPSKV